MQSLEVPGLVKAMGKEELEKTEKILIQDDPFLFLEKGYLTIKTKVGRLQTLILNSTQRRLLNKIREIRSRNKPVRLYILKARQAGISTLIEALLFVFTSQKEGINSIVIADDIDGANYLFGMQKLFYEMLPAHLVPQIKHSNEKKLEFENIHSQVLIDTADNLDAGRKYTFQYCHLSEISRYRNFKELMLGLSQAVPKLPGTMIICETTANGIGNDFYDEWESATEGLSDWETFFLGWNEIEEYSMPLVNDVLYPIEGMNLSLVRKVEFLKQEDFIRKKYNLTMEQLNWRRWCIINDCGKNVLHFNQEYPISPEEAFISTGDIFFDKEKLKSQEIKRPLAVGNIVKEEGRYVFREYPEGLFKIYEFPKKDEQYVVSGDPAEGLAHGDKTAGIVLSKRSNVVVCVYNHNIPPDRFAEDLVKMASWYNEAVIACENKSYGYGINQDIYKHYGKIYRWVKTSKGFPEPGMDLGWNTNSSSRPQMLAQLAEEIFEGSTELSDKDLIKQCWTFIKNPKRGQPEAEPSKCDDLVMARAIAGQVRLEQPYKEKFIRRVVKKRFKGLVGY